MTDVFLEKKKKSECGCCPFFKFRKKVCENSDKINQKTLIVPPTYTETLPKNLERGDAIDIKGQILKNCQSFSVNLVTKVNDVALHWNPRLLQRYIVRNCRINGIWGREETNGIGNFDIGFNKEFNLSIFVGDDQFLVSLDGQHNCGFAYRVPISTIKTIEINGFVEIHEIEYNRVKNYPLENEKNYTFRVPRGHPDVRPSDNLVVPVTAYLSDGFQIGWALEIYGRVKMLPHSFLINLQKGCQRWPHPEVPLHFNTIFSFGSSLSDGSIIRNSFYQNKWNSEERSDKNCFPPGSKFFLVIKREPHCFSIWIDKKLSSEFKFRGDVEGIDTLYIQGDVAINGIYMHDHPEKFHFED